MIPAKKLASGHSIPVLGLGTWELTGNTCVQAIQKALELGYMHIDTAQVYGNQAEIGKAIANFDRKKLFITSKIWRSDLQSKSVEPACNRILDELKTDYVDLWQVHAIDSPEDVDNRIKNGVLDAFVEAQEKGKVKHIGFTGHTAYKAHLRMMEEADRLGVKMVSAQMPINPADPHYESFILNVLPKCVEAGIGVLGMKSLAWGRFFGGNMGWLRKDVSVKPIVPNLLSIEDVFGFVWSLPVSALVSGMQTVEQVAQNATLARKTWNWNEAERQQRIDAVVTVAGPDLEFYKA